MWLHKSAATLDKVAIFTGLQLEFGILFLRHCFRLGYDSALRLGVRTLDHKVIAGLGIRTLDHKVKVRVIYGVGLGYSRLHHGLQVHHCILAIAQQSDAFKYVELEGLG